MMCYYSGRREKWMRSGLRQVGRYGELRSPAVQIDREEVFILGCIGILICYFL